MLKQGYLRGSRAAIAYSQLVTAVASAFQPWLSAHFVLGATRISLLLIEEVSRDASAEPTLYFVDFWLYWGLFVFLFLLPFAAAISIASGWAALLRSIQSEVCCSIMRRADADPLMSLSATDLVRSSLSVRQGVPHRSFSSPSLQQPPNMALVQQQRVECGLAAMQQQLLESGSMPSTTLHSRRVSEVFSCTSDTDGGIDPMELVLFLALFGGHPGVNLRVAGYTISRSGVSMITVVSVVMYAVRYWLTLPTATAPAPNATRL